MIWQGKHISLWNNAYNCTMNDPMMYKGSHGWHYLYDRLRFLRNRSFLRKALMNDHLGDSIVVGERTVEVPLAIDFLDNCIGDGPVLELGCVLPYYIFKSSKHVVYDLVDSHPANIKKDLRDLVVADFKTNIISISTLEHISQGDYGIERSTVTAVDILRRILENAKQYFITFPLGYNLGLDKYAMENVEKSVFITRRADNRNDWIVVGDKNELSEDQKKYGGYCGANTICVITTYMT